MDQNTGLSYKEFLSIFQRQRLYHENKNKEMEPAPAEDIEIIDEEVEDDEENIEDSQIEEAASSNPAEDAFKKLCRICGSTGHIDIFSTVSDKFLTIPRSRAAKMQNVTIAEMINLISDEDVDKNDQLPSQICLQCCSYLQHSYNIRLQIKTSAANFREIKKVAAEESVHLEINAPKVPVSVNQREIFTQKEEIEEDKYWHENFERKNANIRINTKTSKKKQFFCEIKCPGCFKKSYSTKSHNAHMNYCIVNTFQIFFSGLKSLFTHRFEKKITEKEFVIYCLSLLFNYAKKIQDIAAKTEINIENVTKHLPPDEVLIIKESESYMPLMSGSGYFHRKSPANSNNRFTSPDFGYSSTTQ